MSNDENKVNEIGFIDRLRQMTWIFKNKKYARLMSRGLPKLMKQFDFVKIIDNIRRTSIDRNPKEEIINLDDETVDASDIPSFASSPGRSNTQKEPAPGQAQLIAHQITETNMSDINLN